ncbi:MAG: thioredoxin [Candidatus Doudnabacteria bacterium]|nr:thioredoxin [bacterium]MDZ4243634.1 thioredoxin [Candidatus Doudnabacteria bacterium]
MEITLNNQNFDKEVIASPVPVIVDFWAEWCGPCHAIAPTLSGIAKDYEGKLTVGKLNVDENPDMAEKYAVRSIPNLKIFKNGQIIDEVIGAMPGAEIRKRIDKHLS